MKLSPPRMPHQLFISLILLMSRWQMFEMYKRLAAGEYLGFNNSVFLSEKECADRNFALAYFMRENKCFPPGTKLQETLEFYFQVKL